MAAVGEDNVTNLIGDATVRTVVAANSAGEIQVIEYSGSSDQNIVREQAQVRIQNSFIRESRDYGIWSEAAGRIQDPRDVQSPFTFTAPLQNKPAFGGTQAVRNLPVANDDVPGGMVPGLIVENNVLEEGGLGGVSIMGESPIWMISPGFIPHTPATPLPNSDNNPNVNISGRNPPPSHFGSFIDDGDELWIGGDRTRLEFEWDDLAGGPAGGVVNGSGVEEGDGVAPDSSIIFYRDTGGQFYQRLTGGMLAPFATNAYETMHALRDSILGSILVTNGTTQTITATVAESLLGPDPIAPPTSASLGYPEYFNRPALYLEGPTSLQWFDVPGGYANPFDIRQLDLGEAPQAHARIINNTIIGKDGRVSFNGESPLDESNDQISDAIQTWQGTSHNPLFYSGVGVIGDGGPQLAGSQNGGSAFTSNSSNGQTGGGGQGGQFNSEQFILSFNADVSEEERTQFLQNQNLTVVKRYDFIDALVVKPDSFDTNIIHRTSQLSDMPPGSLR